LLFYKVFPDKSVTIYPNKRSQNCCGLRVDDVGQNIVRAAKQIIINQQTDQATEGTEGSIGELQRNFDTKFAKIETKMESIENKLDMLLRKMTKY